MKLLLIGDERKNRRTLAWAFASGPYRVKTASSRATLSQLLETEEFQAACIDIKMTEDDGAALAMYLHGRVPSLPIVALAGPADRKLLANLKPHGVCAHLVTPFTSEALVEVIAANALPEATGIAKRVTPKASMASAPGASTVVNVAPVAPSTPRAVVPGDESARRILELATRAANSNAAILVLGETGTGKTVLAQTIHQHSGIRHKPFVTVNCPCLNHELLESDLFGHVRGSFTGAVQDTWGKVAAADGGTLFLDEIGDLPMALQPKLLRLLQEKQYERVGETTPRTANVRIIAATNRDLKREVAAGRFREDLYYRINVIAIDVPPLRSRPAQIMAAAEGFLAAVAQQLGRKSPGFTPAARRVLEGYAWPGNLRELRNAIERAAILSEGNALDAEDFPTLLAQPPAARFEVGSPISLHALECAHIQMVVANSSSLEEAARILQIDKSTLYRKRKAMDAQVATFTAPLEEAVAIGS